MRSSSSKPFKQPAVISSFSGRSSSEILYLPTSISGYSSQSSSSRRQARYSVSKILSLTAPVKASLSPTVLSSNFGQRTPGISSSSVLSSRVTHCFPRVTPGRSSTLARLEPARRLMKEDLPTFGIPTIIMRIGLPCIPFASQVFTCSAISSFSADLNLFIFFPLRQSVATAVMPFFL